MRLALLALLLAAPLAAQEPVDTARATAELAISFEPGSVVVRGDTTLVYVGVSHESSDSSILAAVDRASFAMQAAILSQATDSGPPGWFYGGVLVLGAAAILTWAYKDETTTINVDQNQEQTTTTTTRFPWCWPPGHCKRKPGDE